MLLDQMRSLMGSTVEILAEPGSDSEITRVVGYTPRYHKITSSPSISNCSGVYSLKVTGADPESLSLTGDTLA